MEYLGLINVKNIDLVLKFIGRIIFIDFYGQQYRVVHKIELRQESDVTQYYFDQLFAVAFWNIDVK